MAARRSSSSDFAQIEPLLAEVKDNLQGDLDLDALARVFGASPFQFHRKFSTAVGETPRRLIERLRLERAAYLLAVTQARVIDIALDVGFESHETFSRAFRRRFACSPTEWRIEAKVWQTERLDAIAASRAKAAASPRSGLNSEHRRPCWRSDALDPVLSQEVV